MAKRKSALLLVTISLYLWSSLGHSRSSSGIAQFKDYAEKQCTTNTPDCLGELLKYGFAQGKPLSDLEGDGRKQLVSALRFVALSGNKPLTKTLRQQYFAERALYSTEQAIKIHAVFGEYDKVRELIAEEYTKKQACIEEKYEGLFFSLSYSLISAEAVIKLAEPMRKLNNVLLVADQWLEYGRENEAKKLIDWAISQEKRTQWGLTQTACAPCYYDRLKAGVGLDTKNLIQHINTLQADYFSFRHVASITDGFIAAGDRHSATQGLDVLIHKIEQHPGEIFADSGHPWRGDAHRYVAKTLGAYLEKWPDHSTEQQLSNWVKQLETGRVDLRLIAFDRVRYYSGIRRFDLAYKIISEQESNTERLLLELAKYDDRANSPIDMTLEKADKNDPDIVAASIIRGFTKMGKGGSTPRTMADISQRFAAVSKDTAVANGLSKALAHFACHKPELVIEMVNQQAGGNITLSPAIFGLAAQGQWQASLDLVFKQHTSFTGMLQNIAKLYYMAQRGKSSYFGQRYQCD